jgi:hypothetical protein
MIKASQQADDVLPEGKAIVVFLAREFLRDPHFFSCTLRKNLATQGSPRMAIDAGTHRNPFGFLSCARHTSHHTILWHWKNSM